MTPVRFQRSMFLKNMRDNLANLLLGLCKKSQADVHIIYDHPDGYLLANEEEQNPGVYNAMEELWKYTK